MCKGGIGAHDGHGRIVGSSEKYKDKAKSEDRSARQAAQEQ